jgi:hypothetical protein
MKTVTHGCVFTHVVVLLQVLVLGGMDYVWAAAAGYHRPAGFDSAADLRAGLQARATAFRCSLHHQLKPAKNLETGYQKKSGTSCAPAKP